MTDEDDKSPQPPVEPVQEETPAFVAIDPEKQPAPPPPSASPQDVSTDEALSRQAKKPRRKLTEKETKLLKFGGPGVAVLLLILLVYSCQPAQGSMAYGICSTFLQMNTPYPYTLRYTQVEISNTTVWIDFTSIDPFGQYKVERLECKFGVGPDGKARVTNILRGRKPVDPKLVEDLNKAIPTIVSSNPSTALPATRLSLPIPSFWRLHESDQEIFRPVEQP